MEFNGQLVSKSIYKFEKPTSVSRQSGINMHSAGTQARTSWSGGWKYWFSHNSLILSGRIWPNGCIGGFRGSPEGRIRTARKPEKAEATLARACGSIDSPTFHAWYLDGYRPLAVSVDFRAAPKVEFALGYRTVTKGRLAGGVKETELLEWMRQGRCNIAPSTEEARAHPDPVLVKTIVFYCAFDCEPCFYIDQTRATVTISFKNWCIHIDPESFSTLCPWRVRPESISKHVVSKPLCFIAFVSTTPSFISTRREQAWRLGMKLMHSHRRIG